MKICPACGFTSDGDVKFCIKCGAVMAEQSDIPGAAAMPLNEAYKGDETEIYGGSAEQYTAQTGTEYAAQPAGEYQVQPGVEYAAQPGTDYQSQPAADYQSQPAAEYEAQPVSEYQSQPGAEYGAQPAAEYASQPAAEYQSQSGTDYAAQPTGEYSAQAGTEYASQPATDYQSQPAAESQSQPAAEYGAQPAAENQSQPSVTYCPACGAPSQDPESLFCESCGASLSQGSAGAGAGSSSGAAGGKKPVRPWIIVAAAAVLILLAGGAFLLFGRRGAKANIHAAVYMKDGELYYNSLKKNAESLEVAERLFEDDNVWFNPAEYSTYLTRDGKKLFYPDRCDGEDWSYTLYYRNPARPDAEPVKVDSDVRYYKVGENEDCLVYIKGSSRDEESDVYYYDMKEKMKLGTYTGFLNVADDGKKVIFIDDDGKLYYRAAKAENKEKIDSDVADVDYASEDLSTVYYMKEDDDVLYRWTYGKDSEKLIRDVDEVVSVAEDGGVYYYGPSELDVRDFIYDDKKESDAAMKEPTAPERPSWMDKNYDKLYEEYEKDLAAYEEQMEAYYEKLSRDEIRDKLDSMSEEDAAMNDLRPLYYFNGKESIMLAEAAGEVRQTQNRPEKSSLVYTQYDTSEASVSLSEIGWYFDKYTVLGKIYEHPVYSCAVGQNAVELDMERCYPAAVSDKEIYVAEPYDTEDGDEEESGDLYRISITGDKPGEPEFVDDDVAYKDCGLIDDHLMYFKDCRENRSGATEGDLYMDGEFVDSDVYTSQARYDDDQDRLMYLTDFNREKNKGELRIWKNGKTETAAEDVSGFVFETVRSGVLYLGDYSVKKGEGTLYYYDRGKSEEIDDDVTSIIFVRSNKD